MKITLYGAAGDVTGSAYWVESAGARILVDFGMFQGGARLEAKNVLPPGIAPREIDAVLVTHAHLDHVGRLPLLAKHGYRGPIFTTQATRDLAGLILRDSAHIQAHDLERENRLRERAGKELKAPLYTPADVERILTQFRPIQYEEICAVAPGVTARFVEAGHMLGSASIQLTAGDGAAQKRIVFSGDLGPPGIPIIRGSKRFDQADLVFLESTYGDRDHKPIGDTLAEFKAIVEEAVRRKARMLVPAFAVGRTQQILYYLDELFCSGALEPFPVYVDSPMAAEATQIYRHYPDLFDAEALDMQRVCDIARKHGYVTSTPTAQDSMKLNAAPGPCLIMAGSGMCTGGRILHHLRHGLWRPETVVLIVGFQSEGSIGRRLVEGAKTVKIFGDEIAVKAQIHTLNGFSAHAGQSDLLSWFEPLAACKPKVALTHGEARGRGPLAEVLRRRHGIEAALPFQGDVVEC